MIKLIRRYYSWISTNFDNARSEDEWARVIIFIVHHVLVVGLCFLLALISVLVFKSVLAILTIWILYDAYEIVKVGYKL